jgi:CDP-diacylglycerol--serine O-phosphatidyltransferase
MRFSAVKSPTERNRRRHQLRQRVVIAVPSGLTLTNLFFGLFAIVTASQGDFFKAGLFVVLGGVADMLDGRIARATNSGTRFGAELDSLVDIVTFGVAPAMIMYFAVLNRHGWDWVWAFVYVACAAWRLAVFNVEQAGRAKKYFHGLPSPAAGITLATYYWFSQTSLYNETNIVNLPWHQMLRFVMFGLAALMISRIPYPTFPDVGFKNPRQLFGLFIVLAIIAGVYFVPKQFIFPACLLYVVYGLLKTVILGLFNRRAPDEPPRSRREQIHDALSPFEPAVAVASSPRLSVSANTPLSEVDTPTPPPSHRRRRRRRSGGRRPDAERPDRSEWQARTDRQESDRAEHPEGHRERRPRRPRRERYGRTGQSESGQSSAEQSPAESSHSAQPSAPTNAPPPLPPATPPGE